MKLPKAQKIKDFSEIPEEFLSKLESSLPSNRTELSQLLEGGLVLVCVYKYSSGEIKTRMFDRIREVESYLVGIEDRYDGDPREIIAIYVIKGSEQAQIRAS